LFLTVPDNKTREAETTELIDLARRTGVGSFLAAMHPRAGLAQRRLVTLWVRHMPGETDPQQDFQVRNLNLILLMGYRLMRQWSCGLRLVTVVHDKSEIGAAEIFLRELADLARIPKDAERIVLVGRFQECVQELAYSDVNIMGLQRKPDYAFVRQMVNDSHATCLFVMDSGRESAMA
jgi:hypothetical protein